MSDVLLLLQIGWNLLLRIFFPEFLTFKVKLAEWEQNREKERRRLLMEEAESKQQGDAVNKRRSKLFETLMFRLDTLLSSVTLLSLKYSAAPLWHLIINFVNFDLLQIFIYFSLGKRLKILNPELENGFLTLTGRRSWIHL